MTTPSELGKIWRRLPEFGRTVMLEIDPNTWYGVRFDLTKTGKVGRLRGYCIVTCFVDMRLAARMRKIGVAYDDAFFKLTALGRELREWACGEQVDAPNRTEERAAR